MTTHTRAPATNQSAVATLQARHYIPLANKIATSNRYGFLQSKVDKTVMLTVSTRKKKVHVFGCTRLKLNTQHTPVPTSPVGYQLEDCCLNADISTPLATDTPFIAWLESLERRVSTILGTTIRSEFYRIRALDDLISNCRDFIAEAPHPGYTVVAESLLNQLVAAREDCDSELANHHFRMAQIARIAVGAPREDVFKNTTWRRANYQVLHALAGEDNYPFTGELEAPGIIAEILDSGYNTAEVMNASRLLVERYLTHGSNHRFASRERDLREDDKPLISEFLRRVQAYLDRIDEEAANPTLFTGKPRLVVQTGHGSTEAEVWWDRTRGVSLERPATLKVEPLDYEWLQRREVTFIEAEWLGFPVQVGQKWGIIDRRNAAWLQASVASDLRARDLLNPEPPDPHMSARAAQLYPE